MSKVFIAVLNTAYEGDSIKRVFKLYNHAETYRILENAKLLEANKSLDIWEIYIIEEMVHG